jgi:hypothetical protein
MVRPIAAQFHRRVASYALIVALSLGATTAPSVVEARSPEERPKTAGDSTSANENRREGIGHWLTTVEGKTEAQPSFIRSWLAGVYEKLLGLKAAISLAFAHAWKWSHGKPDNTCS